MKRVVEAVNAVMSNIEKKDIMEVACGCGEFSLAASEYAKSIICIDLDDKRLIPEVRKSKRICFKIMDAANLKLIDESVDTVIFYNALAHIASQLEGVLHESMRVLRRNGTIIFVYSFSIDKIFAENQLIPMLKNEKKEFSVVQHGNFDILFINV